MKQKIINFLYKKIILKKGIKLLKNKDGFSLIEIMVALGLLVVIGGIAVPQYNAYKTTARERSISATVGTVNQAITACLAIENDVGTCLDDDGDAGSINGTLKLNSGIHVEVKTAGTNTCYYIVEGDDLDDPVEDGKMFGRIGYVTATGVKVDGLSVEPKVATSSDSVGCATSDHAGGGGGTSTTTTTTTTGGS